MLWSIVNFHANSFKFLNYCMLNLICRFLNFTINSHTKKLCYFHVSIITIVRLKKKNSFLLLFSEFEIKKIFFMKTWFWCGVHNSTSKWGKCTSDRNDPATSPRIQQKEAIYNIQEYYFFILNFLISNLLVVYWYIYEFLD